MDSFVELFVYVSQQNCRQYHDHGTVIIFKLTYTDSLWKVIWPEQQKLDWYGVRQPSSMVTLSQAAFPCMGYKTGQWEGLHVNKDFM